MTKIVTKSEVLVKVLRLERTSLRLAQKARENGLYQAAAVLTSRASAYRRAAELIETIDLPHVDACDVPGCVCHKHTASVSND